MPSGMVCVFSSVYIPCFKISEQPQVVNDLFSLCTFIASGISNPIGTCIRVCTDSEGVSWGEKTKQ